MKRAYRWIGLVACCGFVVSAGGLLAQDWPQWRGANRDGKATGFAAPSSWPGQLTQKWTTKVGLGDATPSLVGAKLYVFARQGDDEVLLCLDAGNGSELWRSQDPAPKVGGPASSHAGPRSSPTVAEGKVLTLGVGGVLSCWDAASGALVWRVDEFANLVPQFFTSMSPIVVDQMCLAHLGGKDKGVIVAVDLASGGEKWRWGGDGPAYASPMLMTAANTKQLVVQTEKSLLGLAVGDGQLLWQVATPIVGRAQCAATPIVDGQTVIYTGQGRGTSAVKVEKKGDAFSAVEVWTNEELGTGFNTPVLKDGMLFGLSDRNNFYCMNAQTGQVMWTDSAKRERFGAIVDAGSAILALPSSSELAVFKPSDQQYEQVAQYKLAETPIYAHPVVAGNRIFVKDEDAVTLWTIE